jgi:hypothetical protein
MVMLTVFALAATFGPLASRAVAQPGTEVAAIETTASLEDDSEASVKDAMSSAVKAAFRGALAMGLPWVRIAGAYVRPGYVGVKVLATAQPPDGTDGNDGGPGKTPDSENTPDSQNAPDSPNAPDEKAPMPHSDQIQKFQL